MTNEERPGERKEAAERCGEDCPISALIGAASLMGSRMMDLFPAEFVEHVAGSRREFLLALRSLVDEALRAQEVHLAAYHERQAGREARKTGPQKVAVE